MFHFDFKLQLDLWANVQIKEHPTLSRFACRTFTILWDNAHKQGIETGKGYSIKVSSLLPSSIVGYEMFEEAVTALLESLILINLLDGCAIVTLLGSSKTYRAIGGDLIFTYRFDDNLVAVLKEAFIGGQIKLPILMSVS